MQNFVRNSAKPEWGYGLLVSEQGSKTEVLFENETGFKKMMTASLGPATPPPDSRDALIHRARDLGLIPARDLSPEEGEKWQTLRPLIIEFMHAASNKEGIDRIEGSIYAGFIVRGPNGSRVRSAVKAQLLRWIRTNRSGVFANAITPARRLFEALLGYRPDED